MRDNGRVVATVRKLIVSLPGRQIWSFDPLFLELCDSDGTVIAEGDRSAVLPTRGPAVVTSSSSRYEMVPNTGSGLSILNDGLEAAVISRRGWMPVWRIDQTGLVLPLGLAVFVMAAMMRRSQAGRSMARSDRRAGAEARAGQGSMLVVIFLAIFGGVIGAIWLTVYVLAAALTYGS